MWFSKIYLVKINIEGDGGKTVEHDNIAPGETGTALHSKSYLISPNRLSQYRHASNNWRISGMETGFTNIQGNSIIWLQIHVKILFRYNFFSKLLSCPD